VKDVDEEKWKTDYVRDGLSEIKDSLAIKNTIPNVSGVLFQREILLRVLEENLDKISSFRVAGDWFTYYCVLAHGKVSYTSKSLNNHRRHEKSITISSSNMEHLREIIYLQSLIAETHGVDERTKRRARQFAKTVYERFQLQSEAHLTFGSNPALRASKLLR
jgi:hypothetical protein